MLQFNTSFCLSWRLTNSVSDKHFRSSDSGVKSCFICKLFYTSNHHFLFPFHLPTVHSTAQHSQSKRKFGDSYTNRIFFLSPFISIAIIKTLYKLRAQGILFDAFQLQLCLLFIGMMHISLSLLWKRVIQCNFYSDRFSIPKFDVGFCF